MIPYFARATAGTEDIAWLEMERLPGIRLAQIDHRCIDFAYSGAPADLLGLRSVDDVYVQVGHLRGLDRARLSLGKITDQISRMDFRAAAAICRKARAIPPQPRYTITASLLGRRSYSRFEAAAAVRDGLRERWEYVENEEGRGPVDLDVRVLIEGATARVGLRLGAIPLHRRPYKLSSTPGSLKPPVAYCLCLLAEIQRGEMVFDPMCGAGTIPIEAALGIGARSWAADIEDRAVQAARANAANASANVQIMQGDAAHMPLPDASVDRLICNLPWGKQVLSETLLADTYRGAIRESARVLGGGGRAVLLTDRADLLLPCVDSAKSLAVVSTRQISLYGSHPTIYVLDKDDL